MFEIRAITDADWDAVWTIIAPVFQAGETYPFAPDITNNEAHQIWVEQPAATFVAVGKDGEIAGTYYIKSNQPGLGDHVCNCGYIVSEAARGQGVAATMCQHSQEQARAMGYRAMQYNLVVATNAVAVKLWQSQGFKIVGTLAGAFRHSRLGFVDAHVMFKTL